MIKSNVLKVELEERGDENFKHVETCNRVPRVAILLAKTGACGTRADISA